MNRRIGALGAAALALSGCVQEPQRSVVVVPSQSCNTAFRVVNASSRTVERLYFSHSSMNGWGNDQLGSSVLLPGRQVSYRAANTGNYDFRVIWNNGQAAELRRINVCVASRITVTNSGLRAN
ncbi:hypothetical protein HB662_17530 [Roseomonas frigidaquae]|uniref:Lipoprotein n=1 Tax=Falsiroseomonas frigidaquae TaxID=487318 RepID=A0ABX1F2L9_9PROT|nr:hypothetical protein [Falsiroseomonas frigidaquae]NKE46587.1 hypothetical protein [Falsiroseomonas frigidaquae]